MKEEKGRDALCHQISYSELILRELDKERELFGHNITNIRYADDTVLSAESADDLQRLLDVVVRERKDLSVNTRKQSV